VALLFIASEQRASALRAPAIRTRPSEYFNKYPVANYLHFIFSTAQALYLIEDRDFGYSHLRSFLFLYRARFLPC